MSPAKITRTAANKNGPARKNTGTDDFLDAVADLVMAQKAAWARVEQARIEAEQVRIEAERQSQKAQIEAERAWIGSERLAVQARLETERARIKTERLAEQVRLESEIQAENTGAAISAEHENAVKEPGRAKGRRGKKHDAKAAPFPGEAAFGLPASFKGNIYFHILVRGIIIDKDFILVARAKNAHNTFLPGGHLEFNEDLKKALYREIMEETGINCIIDEYAGCVENQWTENDIINQEINHLFMVNGINKEMEIKSKEKHLEFHWINIHNMERENLLPASTREIIKGIYNNNRINYISEITSL
jgi:ADP-ribose pyrophosphatase YjhB (NUDIX family)